MNSKLPSQLTTTCGCAGVFFTMLWHFRFFSVSINDRIRTATLNGTSKWSDDIFSLQLKFGKESSLLNTAKKRKFSANHIKINETWRIFAINLLESTISFCYSSNFERESTKWQKIGNNRNILWTPIFSTGNNKPNDDENDISNAYFRDFKDAAKNRPTNFQSTALIETSKTLMIYCHIYWRRKSRQTVFCNLKKSVRRPFVCAISICGVCASILSHKKWASERYRITTITYTTPHEMRWIEREEEKEQKKNKFAVTPHTELNFVRVYVI